MNGKRKFREVIEDDLEKGVELVCIYDTDEWDNYANHSFTVKDISYNHDKGCFVIDLERGDGVRSDWDLEVINGEPLSNYQLRMIPISWLTEEEQFMYRMSGELDL